MKKLKSGFSLIELMMVVAIIAFLASITMGYLGSARKRGDDAAVKSNLATLRAVSEIFYLENGNSYLPAGGSTLAVGTCPTYNASGTNMFAVNKPIADAITETANRGGGMVCANSINAWSVAVRMKENPATSWCVDNQGAARAVSGGPAVAINASTLNCNP